MYAEHNAVGFETHMPRFFELFCAMGITSIMAGWCLYLFVLAVVYGYRETAFGNTVLVVLFFATGFYYFLVFVTSISIFMHGTRYVM